MSDLTTKEALDLARGWNRTMKGFAKLTEVLEATVAAEAKGIELQQRLRQTVDEIGSLKAERDTLSEEMVRLRQRANEETLRIGDEMGSLAIKLQDAKRQTEATLADNAQKTKEALEILEADYGARKVALQAEVAGLEARVSELQKKRDEFRALVG